MYQGHGLALVYNEMLQTNGGQHFMYTEQPMEQSAPFLVGKTYGTAIRHYPNAVVCGIIKGDGSAMMLPPHDTLVEPSHRLIAMARDRQCLFAWRLEKPRPKTAQTAERERMMVEAARGAKEFVGQQAQAQEAKRSGTHSQNILSTVTLYSEYTRKLIFQNLL